MKKDINKLIGERLSELMDSTRLTQREFAQKYHYTQSALSKWLTGINTLSLPTAYELIKAFNQEGIICSIDWLCREEAEENLKQNQNEMVQEHASTSITSLDEELIHEIAFLKKLSPHYSFLIMPDEAMEPIFNKGDYIGGKAVYGSDIPHFLEGFYIIETSDGFRGARRLSFNSAESIYECSSANSSFPSYEVAPKKLISVAKITWHKLMN